MTEIQGQPEHLARLHQGSDASGSRNIDAYLDKAVYREFRGLVVIDEARPELHHVLEKINANISVLEFRCFVGDNGERLFEFDTLYGDDAPIPAGADPKPRAPLTPEARYRRRARRALADTVIVPAREEGFRSVFLGEDRWYSIRIGAAMKERIKYVAAYQVAPVSAVTHIAEVQDIRPYGDSGKYMLVFKGPATEIGPIKIADPNRSPQGPVYVEREKLLAASRLEQALDAVTHDLRSA